MRATYPREALGWAGTRAAGCRDVISALWPGAPRDYLTRPVPASCARPRTPARDDPLSADQRRLVMHHDQTCLARGCRCPHAGFQRRAALPTHPVARQERSAHIVHVNAADGRRGTETGPPVLWSRLHPARCALCAHPSCRQRLLVAAGPRQDDSRSRARASSMVGVLTDEAGAASADGVSTAGVPLKVTYTTRASWAATTASTSLLASSWPPCRT